MNKIDELLKGGKKILSIYFTAGYPSLESTGEILLALQEAGVDMVEIGMPFSDPVADGPVIQESSRKALENGMSLDRLFRQLDKVMPDIRIPVILMGYLNPVVHMGFERFCKRAVDTGVSGIILPDMSPELSLTEYHPVLSSLPLKNIFLITPQTPDDRVRFIDRHTGGFMYMVSSPSVTGGALEKNPRILEYFERIRLLFPVHPGVVGFGISTPARLEWVLNYARGGIIGSAFVKSLAGGEGELVERIEKFVRPYRTVCDSFRQDR